MMFADLMGTLVECKTCWFCLTDMAEDPDRDCRYTPAPLLILHCVGDRVP